MKTLTTIANKINTEYKGVVATINHDNKIDIKLESPTTDLLTQLQFSQLLEEFNLYVFHAYNGFSGDTYEVDFDTNINKPLLAEITKDNNDYLDECEENKNYDECRGY